MFLIEHFMYGSQDAVQKINLLKKKWLRTVKLQ